MGDSMTLCHLTLKAERNPESSFTDPSSYHTVGSECLREKCGAWVDENKTINFQLMPVPDKMALKSYGLGHCALVPRER